MEKKRLYRSTNDKMIGGVCGGIAEFFNVDSTLIRILFVLFFFIGGSSILLYIISLIIVPLNPELKTEKQVKKNTNFSFFAGAALIIFGLLLFFHNIGFIPFRFVHFSWDIIFSVVLIVLGILLILKPDKIIREFESKNGRLTKSIADKMIFGVCSGIANFLNIDATFVRLFWIFFTFSSFGISIILYLTLALVLPNERYIEKEI